MFAPQLTELVSATTENVIHPTYNPFNFFGYFSSVYKFVMKFYAAAKQEDIHSVTNCC